MPDDIDLRMISNEYAWEAMMQTLLTFADSGLLAFSRRGRDWGIDALSGDKETVYQAKHHITPTITRTIRDAKEEFEKIAGYRKSKDYWKNVKKLVLFTNLQIHIENAAHWNEEIVPLYAKIGLHAELWDCAKILPLLVRFPEVVGPFFRGEARTFSSLSEQLYHFENENWFPPSLEVECVGRTDALNEFDKFLKSNLRVWPVSGAGGMGKSRFLLECAMHSPPEWTPYWANPSQLRPESLYKSIVPEKKLVLC